MRTVPYPGLPFPGGNPGSAITPGIRDLLSESGVGTRAGFRF